MQKAIWIEIYIQKILLSKVIKMSTCLLSKRKSMVFSTFVPDIMQQECYEKKNDSFNQKPTNFTKKNHVDQKNMANHGFLKSSF